VKGLDALVRNTVRSVFDLLNARGPRLDILSARACELQQLVAPLDCEFDVPIEKIEKVRLLR
jgi:hypothetical protein